MQIAFLDIGPGAAIGPAGGLSRGGLRSLIEIPGDYLLCTLLPSNRYAFTAWTASSTPLAAFSLIRGEALDPGGAVPDEGLDGFGVVRHEPGGDSSASMPAASLEPVEAVEARAVPAVVEPEGGARRSA